MRSVADGARSVEDDLGRGVGFGAVDGGVDAGELRGDEGKDGSAASGDAVLREEDEEIGQEIVEAAADRAGQARPYRRVTRQVWLRGLLSAAGDD